MEAIYNGNSLKSGVYQIRNLVNDKLYVGSAKEFKNRYKTHLNSLAKGTHYNKHLQASFNKYGTDAFVFEILELTEGTLEERRLCEQKHIDRLVVEGRWANTFNCAKQTILVEGSSFSKAPDETRKKHSESSKAMWKNQEHRKNVSEKCSAAAKKQWECEETRERMIASVTKASEHLKGKSWGNHTEETKRKISESHKGLSEPYKGRKLSDEQRTSYAARLLSYSETRKAALRKVLCKKLTATSETECLEFDSIVEAAACLELSRSTIRHCLRKGTKAKKQWLFRLAD